MQKGDVVRLKSGGPDMTVESELKPGRFVCHWFDKEGKLQSATFNEETLDIAKAGASTRVLTRS
jgi:uncharacterized protein YodC (DUF2158 family)